MFKNSEKFKYLGKAGYIAGIFFVGFSIYLFISTVMLIFLTKSLKEVKVPDVVDKRFIDVYNSIERAGLKSEVDFRDVFDLDDGIILKQSPEAGEVVSENTRLKLLVTRNVFRIGVPNLVGSELPIALNKLKNLNYHGRSISLRTGVISYIPSEKYRDNIVIAQSPEAREKVNPEHKINLLVSAGSLALDQKVPSVVNQSIDICYELLASKGFVIYEEIVQTGSVENAGIVVSQKPEAQSILQRGGVITLTINWYPLRDHPFRAYEKTEYVVTDDDGTGLYEVYVEDNQARRIVFSRKMGPGQKIICIFRRVGNAKVSVVRDKNPVRVMGINIEE